MNRARSQAGARGSTKERRWWRAVLDRDARLDAGFVYAVRSTGVYCRASCPARRPRREQVVFFPSTHAAERAGFRACRRCRPKGGDQAGRHAELVRAVCGAIEARAGGTAERRVLNGFNARAGYSPHYARRAFKRLVGITPRQYAEARRLERLKQRLKDADTVTRAMHDAGYSSSSRLYEGAARRLGMTPGTYRRGGRGVCIGYTIARCRLGRLLLAATERGVCFLCMGHSERELQRALRREYPRATIQNGTARLARWVRAIVKHLEGREAELDLPLDVRATAFQWRVWEELRAIPYAQTRSYREIARRLGRPAAARAVGRACASNPLAVVIPCHRAVREDGGLGGYRWGLERKRSLLARERQGAGPGASGGRRVGASAGSASAASVGG